MMRPTLLLLASCLDAAHAFGIVPDSRSAAPTPCQQFFLGENTPLRGMPDSAAPQQPATCAALEGRNNLRLQVALGQPGPNSWCAGATKQVDCENSYVHHLAPNPDGVAGQQHVVYTLCSWDKDTEKCAWDTSTQTPCPFAPNSLCSDFESRAVDSIHQGSNTICAEFTTKDTCVSSVSRTEGTDTFHVCKWGGGRCANLDGPMTCVGRRALQGRSLSEADPCEAVEENQCNGRTYTYAGADFIDLPTSDFVNAQAAPEHLHVCSWNKEDSKCRTVLECPYSCALVGARFVDGGESSDPAKAAFGARAIGNQRFCSSNGEVLVGGQAATRCGQFFSARKSGSGKSYALQPCVWDTSNSVPTCDSYTNAGYDLQACI